ncbi:hypothetical protein GOB25_19130 [Sinorhizobium meliloti]|nr:hypothetical protein [Sinorhizobium meliloti]
MSRRRKRPSESNLALSFIDTISGGFGAAFFLFLIFASMPFEESSAIGGASRFMEIWLRWQSVSDLMEITLVHESGAKIRLTARDFEVNPYNGTLKSASGIQLWRSAQANGFSWFGEDSMKNGANSISGMRLRLADPCPGNWQMTATLHSRPAGEAWLGKAVEVPHEANVRVFDGVSKNTDYVLELQNIIPGASIVLKWKTDEGVGEQIHVLAPPRQELAYCPMPASPR